MSLSHVACRCHCAYSLPTPTVDSDACRFHPSDKFSSFHGVPHDLHSRLHVKMVRIFRLHLHCWLFCSSLTLQGVPVVERRLASNHAVLNNLSPILHVMMDGDFTLLSRIIHRRCDVRLVVFYSVVWLRTTCKSLHHFAPRNFPCAMLPCTGPSHPHNRPFWF